MDDVVETKVPVVYTLGDLARNEDLVAALRHAAWEPARPLRVTPVTAAACSGAGFNSAI